MIEFLFAYVAGVLTLINPCVLPILPVVLAGSLNENRLGPLALIAGLCTSFTLFGIGLAALGPALGIDEQVVSQTAAVIMILLGLFLVLPVHRLSPALAGNSIFDGTANLANRGLANLPTHGLGNQFLGGLLLGAAWGPCIGPTLGGAIALAYEGSNLGYATAIMFTFSLGVATIMLTLAYGARNFVMKFKGVLRNLAGNARYIIGGTFIVLGLSMFFKLHLVLEAKLLNLMPDWLIDFSVRF